MSLFDIRLCIRFYNINSAVKATKRTVSNPRTAAVKNSIENTLASWKVFWRAQQLTRACPEKAVQPRALTISSVQSTRTCIFTLVEYSQPFFRNCLKKLSIKMVANTSLPNQTIMELCHISDWVMLWLPSLYHLYIFLIFLSQVCISKGHVSLDKGVTSANVLLFLPAQISTWIQLHCAHLQTDSSCCPEYW